MPKETYEDHESRPTSRPGMESVVNRGADVRDANGNRTGDRPTASAGKIDPFSVGGDPAPTPAANSAPPSADPMTGAGGRQREQTVMDTVDKDVNGP